MAPVEAVAMALYEADAAAKAHGNDFTAWHGHDDREHWRDLARVAIKAYRKYEKEEGVK